MIEPGSIIAQRFLIERVLGSGGMGVVYLVRHTSLDEHFALKVLRHPEPTDARTSARFLREARAAASLRGEHAVRVLDFGHLDDGAPFFVMEYIDGPSLAALLRRGGPLPPGDAVRAVLHACAALAEAHALGIVHRDIKPANLLLGARSDGSPLIKLADFGVAKLIKAESLTDTRSSLGSPAYMAPEQIRDARRADPRSDIWSLGVTLYELFCGQTPFHAFTAPGILSRVLTEEPTPLSSLRPALPGGLVSVVERCLEKDPGRRYPTVLDLADALSPFAPEPDEGARIRRISAFVQRPPSRPEPAEPAGAAGQATDAPTSLTQATSPPPAASLAPVPAIQPPRRWRPALALALALFVPALAWQRLQRPPLAPPAPSSASPSSGVASVSDASSSVPVSEPAPPLPAVSALPALPVASAPAPPLSPAASAPRSAPRSAAPAPPRPRPVSLGEFGSRQLPAR